MKLFFLLALGFGFVCAMSALPQPSEKVVDWKGDPLKVGVLYELWVVGKDKGPVAIGSSPNANVNFVISKPNLKPSLPEPVSFQDGSIIFQETWVRVNRDYKIKFGPDRNGNNYWTVGGAYSQYKNFVTSNSKVNLFGGAAFRLQLVDRKQHLYKLTTQIDTSDIPFIHIYKTVDITSKWVGKEDRLTANEGSEIKLRFVEHRPEIKQVVSE